MLPYISKGTLHMQLRILKCCGIILDCPGGTHVINHKRPGGSEGPRVIVREAEANVMPLLERGQ